MKKSFEREKMIIYLLVNHPKESYERIKKIVNIELIKDERNVEIIKKIFEKYQEKIEPESVTDWFQNQEIINYLSGIIIDNMEIKDVNKAIEDIEKAYNRESMILKRNTIIQRLENRNEVPKEELEELEKELNSVIIELARMK